MSTKILTAEQATAIFQTEYPTLQWMMNPAAVPYDGYKFEKRFLLCDGKVISAWATWDNNKKHLFVVSEDSGLVAIVDGEKDEFSVSKDGVLVVIINYDSGVVFRRRLVATDGKLVFALVAYDSAKETAWMLSDNSKKLSEINYRDVYQKKLIIYEKKIMIAWVSVDAERKKATVVSEESGTSFEIDTCYVFEHSSAGAMELFRFWFTSLWPLFNPCDNAYCVGSFIKVPEGFYAIDFKKEHCFVVFFGQEPNIINPK